MKRCVKCGELYHDDTTTCTIDGQPLAAWQVPQGAKPQLLPTAFQQYERNKKQRGLLRSGGIVFICSALLLEAYSHYVFNDLRGDVGRILIEHTPGSRELHMITDAGQAPALGTFEFISVLLLGLGAILLLLHFVTRKSAPAQPE